MPNARADGMRVASFTAPVELVAAAQEKAAGDGRTLSDVIREALAAYVAKG